MLGFVQHHHTQPQAAQFFLVHIAHFRVIGVPARRFASGSLFLDQVLGSDHIHPDAPIKGGLAQLGQPFLLEMRPMEQFSIRGTSIDEQRAASVLPAPRRIRGIQSRG